MDALTAAYEAMKHKLISGVWNPGDRLPSLAAMAHECSVSRTTMWKAIGLLQKESLVHTRMRGSIIAGPLGVSTHSRTESAYGWTRLKARLKQDMIRGALGPEPLPPMNKLALRYNVGLNTVRKSVRSLEQERVLAREGRYFRKAETFTTTTARSIMLIASGDEEHEIRFGDWRMQRIAESFERECVRLNFESRCIGFEHDSPAALLQFTGTLQRADNAVGFIVSMWDPITDVRRRRWMDLLRLLASKGKPVIVADQDSEIVFPAEITSKKNIRILRIAGESAGEAVGAALVRRGGDKVVYLSGAFHQPWAQKRYAGLTRYMQTFSSSHAPARLVALDLSHREMALTLSFLGLDNKETAQLFSERFGPQDRALLDEDWQTARKIKLSEPAGSERVRETARDFSHYVLSLAARTHSKSTYDKLLSMLMTIAADRATDCYLEPLFKKALNEGPGKTWVCSDDKTAIIACNFLRAQKVKIPEEIAVVGFENWLSAAEQNITSFDFNMHGFVLQAMLMIMDEQAFKARPPISEIEGFVVERQTTRR
jgi:DNA-binding transcriptional regulator YhcF (GntR family)/DNA-binding LacI/PurR family transcriptional regulator